MEPSELRSLRQKAGLSQADMAAKIGLSRVQVSRIERGVSSTPVETVIAWHRACGYRLESVGLAHEPDSEALATALSRLDRDEVRVVVRFAGVLPRLTPTERAVVRALVEGHEQQS